MAWFTRALNLLRSRTVSSDIDREMSFHLAERADDLVENGMDADRAEREARRRFGHPTVIRETTRRIDMLTWVESIANDTRLAARALRASPGFTLVTVLSLGLGIGANTAIFSLINAVMVKSLPVQHAAQLVTISSAGYGAELSNPLFEQLRDRQTALESIAAFTNTDFNLSNGGVVRRIAGTWVTGDFFATLGVDAATGRLTSRSDDVRGCPATAVLGNGFWQSEYSGRPSVIGSSISLAGHPFTIVGVTAPGFFGVEVGRSVQVYAPLCAEAVISGSNAALDERQQWFLSIIGRLPDGGTPERAAASLSAIAPAVLAASLPPQNDARANQKPAPTEFVVTPGVHEISPLQAKYRQSLLTLMAVVVLVLLIGCANVANLLLARAAARQHEIAVRFALGATRLRVVRQLVTETMLLTGIGAVVAVFFAKWSSSLLVRLLSSGRTPIALDVPIDARVLLFTTAIAAVAGLLFGLPPAWRSTRATPQSALGGSGRTIASGHSRFSLAKALVVGQVALSLILVVGAGLFLGTFRTLSTLNPGFNADNVLLVHADLSKGIDTAPDSVRDRLRIMHEQMLERIRATPGVSAVSASRLTPVSGSGWNAPIAVPNFTPTNRRESLVFMNEVSDDFFSTLGTHVLAGRAFDRRDQSGTPVVAIINQALARKFFGGTNPVGQTFRMPRRNDPGPIVEVVGVVEDAKYSSLREAPRPTAYLALNQSNDPVQSIDYEVRTTGTMSVLVPQITALAAHLSPRISLEYRTLDNQVAASLTRERLVATLSAFFGALALLLAMVGLYGTMSYGVARRRNEIGVRLALGATRTSVLGMVLGETGLMLVIGLAIGLAGALASSKLIASFLYGVTPTDTATLAWSALTLTGVALLAGALPAWRAARLDPMIALRQD